MPRKDSCPVTQQRPCFECARRRRVCNFVRPECHNCQHRGIKCPGYDNKPLKWLDPGQVRSRVRRRSNGPTGFLNPGAATVYAKESIIENIAYYNRIICPDLQAWEASPSDNAFLFDTDTVSQLHPLFIENLFAVTLTHQILSNARLVEDIHTNPLATTMCVHRGRAIGLLRDLISESSSPATDRTLVAVLALLLSEVQQSISPVWHHHLAGAHAIIDLWGGLGQLMQTRPSLNPWIRYLVLADILGATTTPYILPETIQRQMAIVDQLPRLFGSGLSTAVPCPPALLRELVLINQRRAMQQTFGSSTAIHFESTEGILSRVCDWEVAKWAAQVTELQSILREDREDKDKPINTPYFATRHWLQVGQAYQAAVALYCISSLSTTDHELVNSIAEVTFNKNTLHRVLSCSLTNIANTGDSRLRKLVLWPLVIAGIEDPGIDQPGGFSEFIQSQLLWASRAMGTASPLVASALVRRIWQQRQLTTEYSRSQCWDDLFDKPYVFGI